MSLKQQKELLIVFTKNPKLGKVKTRLARDIGETKALEIYKLLIKKTVEATKNLQLDVEVHYSEEINTHDFWENDIFYKKSQVGNELGERMEAAFKQGFENNYTSIVIIGSDLPDLSQKVIEEAFFDLKNYDVVLGPAKDGGYYLLGMKSLHSKVFNNKQWGTGTVLKSTLTDLKNKNVKLLEILNDIDIYDDLLENDTFRKHLDEL